MSKYTLKYGMAQFHFNIITEINITLKVFTSILNTDDLEFDFENV